MTALALMMHTINVTIKHLTTLLCAYYRHLLSKDVNEVRMEDGADVLRFQYASLSEAIIFLLP